MGILKGMELEKLTDCSKVSELLLNMDQSANFLKNGSLSDFGEMADPLSDGFIDNVELSAITDWFDTIDTAEIVGHFAKQTKKAMGAGTIVLFIGLAIFIIIDVVIAIIYC